MLSLAKQALLRFYESNKHGCITFLGIVVVGGGLAITITKGVDALQASARVDNDLKNQNSCQGKYNTVVCHQYKIDQILLEEKYKGK